MKKLLAIFLAAMMLLSLAACTNNDDNPSGSENNPGTSQSDNQGGTENQGGEDWMAKYNMSNLVVPEGATVTDTKSYTSKKYEIKRDTAFTEDEVVAFVESVLDNCDGAYKNVYDSATDTYVKTDVKVASDAGTFNADDESSYSWVYTDNGTEYDIRITYYSVLKTISFA